MYIMIVYKVTYTQNNILGGKLKMGTPRIQHGEKQDMLYDIKKGISSLDFMNKYERCEYTYYSLKYFEDIKHQKERY